MTKDEKQLIRILNRHVERNQRKAKIQDKSPEIEGASVGTQPKLHIACTSNVLGDCYETPSITIEPKLDGIVDYDLDVKYNSSKIEEPHYQIDLNGSLEIPSVDLDVETIKFDAKNVEAFVIVRNHEFGNYKKLKTLLDSKETFSIRYIRSYVDPVKHYPEDDHILVILFYGGISFVGFNEKNKLCFKIKGNLIQ